MYFYLPNQRYWNDKVMMMPWDNFSHWSIYEIEWQWAVCLGDEVAFSELIKPLRNLPKSMNLVFEKVLTHKTLSLVHWFVNHWYTSYHKAMPLWIGDIDQLVKYKKISRKKKGGEWSIECRVHSVALTQRESTDIFSGSLTYSLDTKEVWQTLIVFPTVWSMFMHLKDTGLMELNGSVVLHGQLHASARSKAFRAIKSWSVHTVYSTYSQVFRDWNNLQKVILIDQHAWWYKNFQEPRYFLPTIVQKMKSILWCEIYTTWASIKEE